MVQPLKAAFARARAPRDDTHALDAVFANVRRPASDLALDAHPTTVHLDGRLHHRETESLAADHHRDRLAAPRPRQSLRDHGGRHLLHSRHLLHTGDGQPAGEFARGPARSRRAERSGIYKVVHSHEEWPPQTRPDSVRIERVDFEGEPIVLLFATRWGSEALEVIFRFEEQDGRIARIRAYGFCPETIRAVGEALGVRVLTGLYRAPTPAPGASWPDPGRSGR